MKKITKATFKAFIKKNAANLHIAQTSRFDGMTDCVENCNGAALKPAQPADIKAPENTLGFAGLWLVGGGRDYFSAYEKNGFKGIEVYNSCGSSIVVIPA